MVQDTPVNEVRKITDGCILQKSVLKYARSRYISRSQFKAHFCATAIERFIYCEKLITMAKTESQTIFCFAAKHAGAGIDAIKR